MTGKAGQKRVPASFLRTLPIPLAPLDEQRQIVAQLEKVTVELEEEKARLLRVPADVARFRAVALSAGCLGRLVRPRRPTQVGPHVYEIAEEITAERVKAGSQRGRRSHAGWTNPHPPTPWNTADLPPVPDSWMWSSVGFVALRLQYGTSVRSDADAASGVPNIGMKNLQAGRLDMKQVRYVSLSEDELEAFRLQPGDILFNRTNSPELVGKSAVFEASEPTVFASYLIRVQVDGRLVLPEFVSHWINSPWGRAWARQVKVDAIGQSNINSRKLAAMPIPLPPLHEQARICERIVELLEWADDVEARVEQKLSQLDEVAESVLAAAFAGELVDRTTDVARDTSPAALVKQAERERRDARASRARRRKSTPVAVAKVPTVRVQDAVDALPDDMFRFDDLRQAAHMKYEDLVPVLFSLLEDPSSALTQVFDEDHSEIRLVRSPA